MMKREGRIDRVSIRFDLSTMTPDPRGYLSVWGTVIKAGTRLTYGRADGLDVDEWIELVPESTVFDAAALASLINSPVTFHHPPAMLDTTNTGRFQVGSVIETKRVQDALRARHMFTDERVIQAIRRGVIELSPGYTAIIDRLPKFNGSEHASQRDRLYNHEAVVPEARAGHDNALDKLDALRRIFRTDDLRVSNIRKIDTMPIIKLPDGTEEEVSDAVAQAFIAMQEAEAAAGGSEDDKGRPSSEDAEDDEDDEESEDAPPSTPSASRQGQRTVTVSTSDARPATVGEVSAMIARGRKDSTKDLMSAMDARDTKARTDATAQAEIVTAAKAVLPRAYSYDAKPAEQIMFDAIVAASPKSEARAKKHRKDAGRLRGMFDAIVDAAPEDAGDDSGAGPGIKRTDSSGLGSGGEDRIDKARKDVQKRRDAVGRLASKRIGGQTALRHDSIVNFGVKQGAA